MAGEGLSPAEFTHALGMIVGGAIGVFVGAAVLDVCWQLLRRQMVTIHDGDLMPKGRIITLYHMPYPHPLQGRDDRWHNEAWGFILRLPSYSLEPDYRSDRAYLWCQRAVIYSTFVGWSWTYVVAQN